MKEVRTRKEISYDIECGLEEIEDFERKLYNKEKEIEEFVENNDDYYDPLGSKPEYDELEEQRTMVQRSMQYYEQFVGELKEELRNTYRPKVWEVD